MPDRPLLELVDVSKRYERPDGAGPLVLDGVSLSLAAGQSLAVVGPSGSGKSTLLNIVGGLDRPTAGRVLLDGADLAAMGDAQLAAVRNRRVGFVFQLHHLLPQCTVLENVLVPALVERRGVDKPTRQRAAALLDRVGLSHRLSHRPGELSGGERQRVALVRALINQPDLLLADEPTGSLDSASAETLAELLAELNRQQGLTLLVVTHWPALAERMATVLSLRDGKLAPRKGG